MPFSFVLALGVLAAAVSASVVQLDLQKSHDRDTANTLHEARYLGRRQVSETLDNLQNLYFANITLGTPGQNLRLHIDTGSSDLWCNSPVSQLCDTRLQLCNASGTYDSTASSTYKLVNNDFDISYADGSGAEGDYASDTIGIGGKAISNFQFGVGIRSTSPEGVLGIGYAGNEVQVVNGGGPAYHNLPLRMVDDGLIKSNAYSLWLNDLDASTGQILFGGVNTAKYHGSLHTMPILKVAGQFVEFLVALTGISVRGKQLSSPSSSLPITVLLDSGTTLTYLPQDITRQLYNQVQAVTDTSSGSVIAYVPCALVNTDATIDFTFSGFQISVPFNEVVFPDPGAAGSGGQQFQDGTPACLFGIAPTASSSRGGGGGGGGGEGGALGVLGDTFLRSAYVVYDLANNQISLAQTNFNSTTDNVKAIEEGPAGVPDSVLVGKAVGTDIYQGVSRHSY